MGKSVHNDVLDAAWNVIVNNCDKMVLCSAEPTTFAEANTTYILASAAMVPGDFSIADAAGGGRALTVAQKDNDDTAVAGTGNHVAYIDTVNSKLLYVTTAPSKTVVGGNIVTFETVTFSIGDPA